jgi:hypothetical protein
MQLREVLTAKSVMKDGNGIDGAVVRQRGFGPAMSQRVSGKTEGNQRRHRHHALGADAPGMHHRRRAASMEGHIWQINLGKDEHQQDHTQHAQQCGYYRRSNRPTVHVFREVT